MALNDDAVRVGVTGRVFFAPVGTALPNTVDTALNAAFDEVGHISEDALTESLEISTEVLRSWQRPIGIRTLTTEVNWTWQFQMMETSPLNLELYYGGAETTVAGGVATTAIPAWPQGVAKACVIEIEDGDIITRYALPKVEIGERGEVNHVNTEGTVYDVTVNVLGTSLDDMGYRITNDPTFVAMAS
jgi:hypothetical protein